MRKRLRTPPKCRGQLGKTGATKTHFGEQYEVYFDDWTYCDVSVWIEHGENEKNNHNMALQVAKNEFPDLNVQCVNYC